MLKKSVLLLAAALCLLLVGGNAFAKGDPDLLIRVEKKSPGDRDTLLNSDIPVIGELSESLFVLGDEENLAALEKIGRDSLVIDSAPFFSDYYMIGTRPDSDFVLIKGAGDIIYTEENVLILRVPAGYSIAPLGDAKVFIAPLRKERMKKPQHENGIEKKLAERNELLHTDSMVQKMVNSVQTADINSYFSTVVNGTTWTTRYSSSAGCDSAATYCYNTYAGLGLAAEYQDYNASYAPNAIGTITGAVNPTKVYITISHLDDMPSSGLAPGADDNASGVVAGLEAAKIMSCYAFKNTVKFIACTGEEQGLYGSEAYAADAETRGEDIQGVIAFDMPAWEGDGLPSSGENLDLNYNASVTGSQALGQLFAACATDYSTGLPVDAFDCPSLDASDHYPFWTRGWAAVVGITDNEGYCGHAGNYDYYHTSDDTIANCGDLSFFHAGVKATLATLAELGEPFKITLDKTSYGCTVPVTVIVGDKDLNTNASTVQTVTVTIWSTRESTPENLVLTEQGVNSMIFKGTMNLSGSAPVHGDGYLSVNSGDTITSQYVDALDCDGSTNVTYTATGTVSTDCTPPVISNVAVTNITGTTATVTWTTNEAANSRVTYGTSMPPGTNKDNLTSYLTSHSINLTDLTQCSAYYFSVTSADAVGNSTTDTNGGSYYTFTTLGADQVLFSEDFAGVTPTALPTGWTVINAGSGNNWVTNASGCTNNALMYPYSGTYAANAWAFTPGITLSAGTTYTVSVNQKVYSGSYPETFEIKCGSAASVAGQTITVLASASYTNTSCQALSGTFTAPTTGTYYLSFHCTSPANMWNLYIDDVVLSRPGSCGAELVYDSHTMTEACNGSGTGGGNSILEPGEDATLSITMENAGGAATGVAATLTSTTTGVTVTTNTANFPDIGAGATGTSLTNYVVHVDSTVTCVTTANFTLHSTSTQNPAGTDSYFSINVGQAGGSVSDFSQSFAGVTPPALPTGWTESHTSGNAWVTTASYYCGAANGLYYPYNSSAAANSYVYTPGISLTSGVTYTLNFNQKIQSATYPENFEVKCGTAATPAGQTITILASAQYTNTTCTGRAPTFTVPTTGTYYISWHCTSAADMYYLIIDDINLTHASTPVCNVCTGGCTGNPGAPVITGITNVSACLLDGIQVAYTAGSGATSHDLYRDGSLVVTGYASGAAYVPGDNASHSYVVRAVCGSYYTNSTAMAGTDTGCATLVYSTHGTPAQVTGDGDANYELGEKWSVSVTLQNTGAIPATNVYATLAGNGIEVCTPSMSYGTIAAGATASATYEFVISTSFTPCGGTIGFDVTNKTCTETCSGCTDQLDVFTLTVGQLTGGTSNRFGPDDAPYASGLWTFGGAAAGSAAHCSPSSNAYVNLTRDQYMTLTTGVSTVGYTNIHVYFDRAFNACEAGDVFTMDYSTNGSTWTNAWTQNFDDNAWHCANNITLPAGAQGVATLYIRFYCNANANDYGWIDNVRITGDNSSYDCTYIGSGTCGTCTPPGAPTITAVNDVDACAQSGVQVVYTAGSGATTHDLYVDTVKVVDSYVSGATYNPGNTTSHNYVVRAINTDDSCYTDSTLMAGTDANNTPGAPTITAVNDVDACAQSGVQVVYTAGSGATSHNLYDNGSLAVTGYASGATYNPGNTASHTYIVRAINGTCYTNSASMAGTDANNTPGAIALTATDTAGCGITLTWTGGTGATQFNLYVDTVLTQSSISSGYVHTPGDTASHSYVVRGVNGSCYADSNAQALADASCGSVIPGEVASGTNFTWSGQTMNWTADSNATGYTVYRGLQANLANLINSSTDFCTRYAALATTSADVSADNPSGETGRCYYYLITAYSGAGEGPAGNATAGARQVNTTGSCF